MTPYTLNYAFVDFSDRIGFRNARALIIAWRLLASAARMPHVVARDGHQFQQSKDEALMH